MRELVGAGPLDRIGVVVFPVVPGADGREPVFAWHPLEGRPLAIGCRPDTR